MFTGLVEAEGTLVSRTKVARGARLVVRAPFPSFVVGESIATDGVCLTVESFEGGAFVASASSETLQKTTLGEKAVGSRVNLERALPLGGRLGGHIVGGHVDGVGHVVSQSPDGEATKVVFAYPSDLRRYIAEKGSICVNGVSLTVNGVDDGTFHVMLVPHTRESTAWELRQGERVNLEVDVLARYVARILDVDRGSEAKPAASDASFLEKLRGSGYM